MGVSFVQLDRRDTSMLGKAVLDVLSFCTNHARTFEYRNYTITTANGGGIIRKTEWLPPTEARRSRLSIVHPVDPQRDLSSGSYKWDVIHELLFASTRTLLYYALGRGDVARPDSPRCAFAAADIVVSPDMLERRRLNEKLIASGEHETFAWTWDPASLGLVMPEQYASSARRDPRYYWTPITSPRTPPRLRTFLPALTLNPNNN
ncbi:DNA polymerase sigma-like protein [Rhodotorula toruloides]|uniref:DNA polymerase sigma-like protein n=1 Tax=Rhodotorula toruloides TaxID=5286 RepID=A0A511KQ74_RHOTO|nr:DNA polymerase sigma-like protein [Rhodotorula toruloides]